MDICPQAGSLPLAVLTHSSASPPVVIGRASEPRAVASWLADRLVDRFASCALVLEDARWTTIVSAEPEPTFPILLPNTTETASSPALPGNPHTAELLYEQ